VLAGARDEERGLQAERALREAGADARFVRLDVTEPKSAREAADWVDREYGRLDILVKVNAANPGYTATDLNGHSGFRSVAEGAEASVHLATLDAAGPSGILWGHLWTAGGPADAYGPLPW
jgi:hypothetical protein